MKPPNRFASLIFDWRTHSQPSRAGRAGRRHEHQLWRCELVLLCPAWKKLGTVRTVKPGTVILHSRADDVIPFADSEELVRNSGLSLR